MSRAVSASVLLLVVASASPAADNVEITPDVVYGHKHGLALTFDVFKPREANEAGVLFMVSGGWYSRWVAPNQAVGLFQPLIDRGYTVFSVRHGSSPKFNIPEAVADVRQSVRYIRLHAGQFGVDAERLGVYGGSAGGHLSLMLGTTADAGQAESDDPVLKTSNKVAAVVAFFPPTDIRPWVGEATSYSKNFPALRFDPEEAGDYSPLLHVSPDDPPTLLIHGDEDKLVPVEHSRQIYAAFEEHKVPAQLVEIVGAKHGFAGEDAKRANAAMLDWFDQHLRNEG